MSKLIKISCPYPDCHWSMFTGLSGENIVDRMNSLRFTEEYTFHVVREHDVPPPNRENYVYRGDNHA